MVQTTETDIVVGKTGHKGQCSFVYERFFKEKKTPVNYYTYFREGKDKGI